jgi:hypothetical protein
MAVTTNNASGSPPPAADGTNNDIYKAVELKFRKKFGLSADVKLDPEAVKNFNTKKLNTNLFYAGLGNDEDIETKPEDDKKEVAKNASKDTTAPESSPAMEDTIRMYPKAGRDFIPGEAVIACIQNPSHKSRDWEKVHSTDEFRCKVRILRSNQRQTKAPFYPTEASKHAGVGLTFSLESQDLAPKLRLSLDLTRNEHALNARDHMVPAHSGSLDFSFGRVFTNPEDRSTTPNQISNLEVEYGPDQDFAFIHFDTTGATANNLKCLVEFDEGHDRVQNIRIRGHEHELAKQLCSVTNIPDGRMWHITIMIRPGNKEKDAHKSGKRNAVDQMLDKLPHKDNTTLLKKQPMTVLPFNQLRNQSHAPRLHHGSMPKPQTVYDEHHPCLPMRPVSAWRDADEAAITLANSVNVQFVESKIILTALEKHPQKVKLLTIGYMVLISITWNKRLTAGLDNDERITYPTGTRIQFNIHNSKSNIAPTDSKPFFANGIVISNIHNVVCDVIVGIQKNKARDFTDMTSPLSSSKTATHYWATLKADIVSNSCAAMIQAVATTYARQSWVTQQWPALLNDGAKLDSKPLLDNVTCSYDQYQQALHDLYNAHSWNTDQRAHIDQFMMAPGGIAPLTGSSGSGKTEVMLHLIRFCLRVGIHCLCTGMKHKTLDVVVKKFEEKFPDEEKPLRAYTPSTESLTFENVEHSATDETELLALDMVVAEIQELKNKRSRLQSRNSIQHRVIENTKRTDMPDMKLMIPTGSDHGAPVYADDTEYDYRRLFREGLAAREEHPFSDKEYWNEDHLRQFKYVYAALRAEVIQNSRLLFSTMHNVYTNEISQNFSSNNNAIARFDDEAQACAEQPSLISASICEFSKNIVVWAMYGDLEQSGVINLTGRNVENTVDVFYKQSDMSLLQRLYQMGHPFVRLTTQWRQHEILFAPLNQLHYNMSIRTVGSLKEPLKSHTQLMGKIANRPDSEIEKQTEYQKRMLYVNVDSPTMKSKDSPSRANPGYAAYVVNTLFPILREEFGKTLRSKVKLIVPYAKQKELYFRWFFELQKAGWSTEELPEISTIAVAHGDETHLVILDLVNDEYEGFMKDESRCCVAFSRAREQMIVIGGKMSETNTRGEPKMFRDATDGNKHKIITIKRPLLHWKVYFENNLCTHETRPPKFVIPDDLAFYGERE